MLMALHILPLCACCFCKGGFHDNGQYRSIQTLGDTKGHRCHGGQFCLLHLGEKPKGLYRALCEYAIDKG